MKQIASKENYFSNTSSFIRHRLSLNSMASMPKYKQIVNSIANDIEIGYYKTDDQLMSITDLSIEYLLSRDTVEKAYKELKKKGYINAIQGKGYFVNNIQQNKIKVLFVMNKISTYKKMIYNAFVETLGCEYKVDLRVHNYSYESFEDILLPNLGKYNHYVVMPHFEPGFAEDRYSNLISNFSNQELVILDKRNLGFSGINIYQDFENDIYNVFNEHLEKFKKYDKLGFVFPKDANYPLEIVKGFKNFAIVNNLDFDIYNCAFEACEKFRPNLAFVIIEESDLSEMIKFSRKNHLEIGKEMGLIAFNETTLKELLDISVITTDFEYMGKTAAQNILNREYKSIINPFYWIERGSL